MLATNKPFAEIIESSLYSWKAQVWHWKTRVPFGSLVTVHDNDMILYGIVYQIHTGSIDESRYPFAYQKTEEELLKDQPQIFEFLTTRIDCIPVGYSIKKKIQYLLPPHPPKIHAFIAIATPDQINTFFAKSAYLHLLFGLNNTPQLTDELVLAAIQLCQSWHSSSATILDELVHTYALLIGNDYRRIKLFLQRVQAIMQ